MSEFKNKKSIFLKLISLLGYVGFLVFLGFLFYTYPRINFLDTMEPDGGFEYATVAGVYYAYFYIFQFTLIILLGLLFVLEVFLKNKAGKFNFKFLENLKTWLFWLGIIFAFLPVCFCLIILITNGFRI